MAASEPQKQKPKRPRRFAQRLAPRLAPFLLASTLNSAQQQDHQAFERFEDRSGDEAERNRSPLDRGNLSYTQDQTEEYPNPSIGGGVQESTVEQAQAQREQQEELLKTQREFIGERSESSPPPTERNQKTSETSVASETTEQEQEVEDVGEDQEMAQAQNLLRQQAEDRLKREVQQKIVQQFGNQLKKTAAKPSNPIVMAVLIAVVVIYYNILLINKYTFQSSSLPDLKGYEEYGTIAADIGLSCNATCCNPACWPCLAVLICMGVLFGGATAFIQHVTK